MSGATVKLDMDDTSLVQAAKRAGDAIKGVGKEGLTAAKGFTEMGVSLLRTLQIAKGLAETVRGVTAAVKKMQDGSADIANRAGEAGLKRELAAQKLGLGKQFADASVQASGGTSISDRDSFLQSLAESGVKGPAAAQAFNAFATGTVSSSEAVDMAKGGQTAELQRLAGERYDALSPEAKRRLAVVNETRSSEARTLATASSAGDAINIARAREAALRAENPAAFAAADGVRAGAKGALRVAFASVPGLGEVTDSFVDGAVDFGSGVTNRSNAEKILESIQANTAASAAAANARRVNLSARGPQDSR